MYIILVVFLLACCDSVGVLGSLLYSKEIYLESTSFKKVQGAREAGLLVRNDNMELRL